MPRLEKEGNDSFPSFIIGSYSSLLQRSLCKGNIAHDAQWERYFS
jgi:hypothetical protein